MPFVQWDDPDYVFENPHVRSGLTADSAAWAFRSIEYANWHPITWLSHLLDVEMFGLDAGKHHRTSLIFHVVNVLLLFFLVLRITESLRSGTLVAALFALHPLHVESVAWISERKDLLCAMFWFLAIIAWLRFADSRKPLWYLLTLGAFSAGLMSKPMIVTFPFTLMLLDIWPLGRFPMKMGRFAGRLFPLVLEKTPFFLLSAVSGIVAFVAQKSTGAVQSMEIISLSNRLANAIWAYCAYMVKMIFPSGLAAFYPYAPRPLVSVAVIGSFLVLAGITMFVLLNREKKPYIAFGWLWFLGTLVPVIGIVQIGGQSMADRYTYVPLTGLFVIAAVALDEIIRTFPRIRVSVTIGSLLLILPLFAATRVQLGYWEGDKEIWERAAAVTRNNFVSENNLGCYYLERGETEEALTRFNAASEYNPGYADAWTNKGKALMKLGEKEKALDSFKTAVQLAPQNADALLNYGDALDEEGRVEEALHQYERSLTINPGSSEVLDRIGIALGKLNRLPESVEWLKRAAGADPTSSKIENDLAVALDHSGRTDEAIEHFRRSLEIDPGYSRGWYNMALTLARAGRLSDAEEAFREALKIEPDMAEARYYLGATLIKDKRYREAWEEYLTLEQTHPGYEQTRANLEKLNAMLGSEQTTP